MTFAEYLRGFMLGGIIICWSNMSNMLTALVDARLTTRKTTDNNHAKINCENKNNPRELSIIRNNTGITRGIYGIHTLQFKGI